MKREYVALSLTGLFAIVSASVLGTFAVCGFLAGFPSAWTIAVVTVLMLLYVRADVREPIANGTYRRRFGLWRHVGESQLVVRDPPGASEESVTLQ